MKRISLILPLLVLLLTFTMAYAAPSVPMSTCEIPAIPGAPAAPQVVRAVQSGDTVSITFDRALPRESLLEFIALDSEYRVQSVRYSAQDNAYTTQSLPRSGQWLRIDLAWVQGSENATARYNMGGGLVQTSRFDSAFNEFVYDAEGVFMEFRDADSGVWTRFDASGSTVRYSYEAQGMRVWFDLAEVTSQ